MFIHKKKVFWQQFIFLLHHWISSDICHVNIVDNPILATIKLPIVVNHNKLSQYRARFARLFTKCEHLGRKIHDVLLNVITFNVGVVVTTAKTFTVIVKFHAAERTLNHSVFQRVSSLLDSFDTFKLRSHFSFSFVLLFY